MNIDFDRLKYSLTGEYEEVMLEKQLKEKDKEIERLNNIINELEKYCIEEIEDYSKEIKSQYITDNTRVQYEGEKVCFEDILDRLQELKGSDKE